VAEEYVGTATPGHHPAEQIPGHLVGAEPAMSVEGARHTELGLDPHDSSLHTIDITARNSPRAGIGEPICIRVGNDSGGNRSSIRACGRQIFGTRARGSHTATRPRPKALSLGTLTRRPAVAARPHPEPTSGRIRRGVRRIRPESATATS